MCSLCSSRQRRRTQWLSGIVKEYAVLLELVPPLVDLVQSAGKPAKFRNFSPEVYSSMLKTEIPEDKIIQPLADVMKSRMEPL